MLGFVGDFEFVEFGFGFFGEFFSVMEGSFVEWFVEFVVKVIDDGWFGVCG